MTVFIAGATGVLGRRLIEQLRAHGHAVIGLARSPEGARAVESLGAVARRADLFDPDALARAADGAEVVIHAATAIPKKLRPRNSDWRANDRIRTAGTRALAECAARIDARLLLVQGVVWVARPPDGSPFDEDAPAHPDRVIRSMVDGEEIAREAGEHHGFGVGLLRFGWFYSPDAYHTRLFGREILRRRMPIIGRGDGLWARLHVDDAASALVAAAEANRRGLWHVVDDKPVTPADFLNAFAKRLRAPPPRRVPAWLARLVAGKYAVDFLTIPIHTSNARFRNDFGWAPRYPGFEEGLDQVVAAWRAEGFLLPAG